MINTFSRFHPQKFSSLDIYMHAWMDGIYIYTYIKKIKKKEILFFTLLHNVETLTAGIVIHWKCSVK